MATRKRAAAPTNARLLALLSGGQSPPPPRTADLDAAIAVLADGGELSSAVRRYIARALQYLSVILLLDELRERGRKRGRRPSPSTLQAAMVTKVLIDDDRVSAKTALRCAVPTGDEKELGRVKKAYEKINKGGHANWVSWGVEPDLVQAARARLPISARRNK